MASHRVVLGIIFVADSPFTRISISKYVLTHSFQRKAAEKAEKASAARKGKKDPKAPKRPLSAYMFFSQDWRERIKAENPDAGFGELRFKLRLEAEVDNCHTGEVGKLLGAKWKELDDEEKKVSGLHAYTLHLY